MSLTNVIEILLIFLFNIGIKISLKVCNYPTIQKPDYDDIYVNRLSITSFAASIKSNTFDASNFIGWHERMILWLTSMNIMHTGGGPEILTSEAGECVRRDQ